VSFKGCAELKLSPAQPWWPDNHVIDLPVLKGQFMEHPSVIRPSDFADWRPDRMGKGTIFESPRLLVGLNCFEPGQFHALHAHARMDKVYQVVEGEGVILLEGRELPIKAGELVVAPEGVPHGIRNTSGGRLLVLAILAPAP
jgi:mannose-6-phosphate isomerase-like protein (cupin superfamily)